MKKRYYLAGPMSGRPQFNYPLFDRVAERLRVFGYDIVSPAEMDDPKVRKAALASPDGDIQTYGQALGDGSIKDTWGDFLSRDVKLIADGVQGIILLPEWATSKGARLEAFVALGCKHDMRLYEEMEIKGVPNWVLRPIYPDEVMKAITEGVL